MWVSGIPGGPRLRICLPTQGHGFHPGPGRTRMPQGNRACALHQGRPPRGHSTTAVREGRHRHGGKLTWKQRPTATGNEQINKNRIYKTLGLSGGITKSQKPLSDQHFHFHWWEGINTQKILISLVMDRCSIHSTRIQSTFADNTVRVGHLVLKRGKRNEWNNLFGVWELKPFREGMCFWCHF